MENRSSKPPVCIPHLSIASGADRISRVILHDTVKAVVHTLRLQNLAPSLPLTTFHYYVIIFPDREGVCIRSTAVIRFMGCGGIGKISVARADH